MPRQWTKIKNWTKQKCESIPTPSSLITSSHVMFTDPKFGAWCISSVSVCVCACVRAYVRVCVCVFANSNCLKLFEIHLHTIKRNTVYKAVKH